MKISVEYTAQLRSQAGAAEETFELSQEADLLALFQAIAQRHGDTMRAMLFDSNGAPASSILCFVGDEQVDCQQPPVLADGTRVTLLSPISGGRA